MAPEVGVLILQTPGFSCILMCVSRPNGTILLALIDNFQSIDLSKKTFQFRLTFLDRVTKVSISPIAGVLALANIV